jgi:hypothetical protein
MTSVAEWGAKKAKKKKKRGTPAGGYQSKDGPFRLFFFSKISLIQKKRLMIAA